MSNVPNQKSVEEYILADRQRQARSLAEEAEIQLANVNPELFSPPAISLLRLKFSEYIQELLDVSATQARNGGADIISATHVEQASQFLVTTSSRRYARHLGMLGGIMLGTALSSLFAMITTNQYSTSGVVISAVSLLAGSLGVGYSIARD